MNFRMERAEKDDGKTFSPEGIGSFLMTIGDFLNRTMACVIYHGFQKEEPVEEFGIEMNFKVNGKEIPEEQVKEIISTYPKVMGFSTEQLIKMMKDR